MSQTPAVEMIKKQFDKARAHLLKIPAVLKIATVVEKKTSVGIEYFFAGVAAILLICIFSGFLAHPITHLIGFVYPFYATIEALESPTTDDDKMWLTYWVVFSALCVADNFVDFLSYWVPLYYPIKVTFLLWLMLPRFKGAVFVYDKFLKTIFLSGVNAIDAALMKEKST